MRGALLRRCSSARQQRQPLLAAACLPKASPWNRLMFYGTTSPPQLATNGFKQSFVRLVRHAIPTPPACLQPVLLECCNHATALRCVSRNTRSKCRRASGYGHAQPTHAGSIHASCKAGTLPTRSPASGQPGNQPTATATTMSLGRNTYAGSTPATCHLHAHRSADGLPLLLSMWKHDLPHRRSHQHQDAGWAIGGRATAARGEASVYAPPGKAYQPNHGGTSNDGGGTCSTWQCPAMHSAHPHPGPAPSASAAHPNCHP